MAAPIEALSQSPARICTPLTPCDWRIPSTKTFGVAPRRLAPPPQSVSGLTLDGMYSKYMQSQHACTTVDDPLGSALGDFGQLAALDAADTIGPPGAGGAVQFRTGLYRPAHTALGWSKAPQSAGQPDVVPCSRLLFKLNPLLSRVPTAQGARAGAGSQEPRAKSQEPRA
ncbi:hypothetical protein BP6252_04213 [Coleophoma cylindrospora]|uniref:Uncharacterized protein n=1 Tax=Coleophoma cylindrospora TaxID=1849047 RepID=A0A3D8RZW0_9HELO|nr:hypothetical protein BP6252_04213 [Coleophoma cylindrospora]